MTSRVETDVHEANTRSHGASGLEPLALSNPGQAVSLEDDMDLVVVPARINGRIHFVPVPRRVVLASGLAGLAAAAVPATTATAESDLADMGSPFEHFAQLRRVIIQTDNLIGPRHVLPACSKISSPLPQGVEQPVCRRRRTPRAGDPLRRAGRLVRPGHRRRTRCARSHRESTGRFHITGDTDLTAYILGRKAQLAVDTGHPADALGLASAARRTARPGAAWRSSLFCTRLTHMPCSGKPAKP